jgi:hypothetical protein
VATRCIEIEKSFAYFRYGHRVEDTTPPIKMKKPRIESELLRGLAGVLILARFYGVILPPLVVAQATLNLGHSAFADTVFLKTEILLVLQESKLLSQTSDIFAGKRFWHVLVPPRCTYIFL